ncbi:hypothetical protein CEXT_248361 [Caerostris extrusa]|uniref:Uncharacterized protein n=1 Tax=Caerostris extrusa TaxID=172846 RepID=A0AAV4MY68_CAEEX|nr:hypothetical protein CEXT_248361 [Caerostris extrusa]
MGILLAPTSEDYFIILITGVAFRTYANNRSGRTKEASSILSRDQVATLVDDHIEGLLKDSRNAGAVECPTIINESTNFNLSRQGEVWDFMTRFGDFMLNWILGGKGDFFLEEKPRRRFPFAANT